MIVIAVITKAVPTSKSSWSKDRDRYKKRIYILKKKVVIIKLYVQLRSLKNTKYITKEINNNPKPTNHPDIAMYLIAI